MLFVYLNLRREYPTLRETLRVVSGPENLPGVRLSPGSHSHHSARVERLVDIDGSGPDPGLELQLLQDGVMKWGRRIEVIESGS